MLYYMLIKKECPQAKNWEKEWRYELLIYCYKDMTPFR